MSTTSFERAARVAQDVLAGVKADQLDDPTPCQSWTVRDLINHMISAVERTTDAVSSGEIRDVPERDCAQGDYQQEYAQAARQAIEVFNAPSAMDTTLQTPMGELSGGVILGMITTDSFQHAWDLARATGQSTDLDPELAEEVLADARTSVPASHRGPEGQAGFGPELTAPESACRADHLAAFLGRKV